MSYVTAIVFTVLGIAGAAYGFPVVRPQSTFIGNSFKITYKGGSSTKQNAIVMRDTSASYWFSVGDSVRVVDDVFKAQSNLKGRIGKVCETWEKCDVDPTCCCAEQVDLGMSVRVTFEGSDDDERFEHYFAEAELVKTVDNDQGAIN